MQGRDHGVATGDEQKDFVLERAGKVIGLARLPGGAPAPSFEARALAEGNQRSGLDRAPEASRTFNNPDGKFWLYGIDPGTYTIEVLAPGMRPARVEGVEIATGDQVDVGTITVEPGITLRGRVVDAESDAPIAGATVRVTAASAGAKHALVRAGRF